MRRPLAPLFKLALASAWSRRFTLTLVVLSIALSTLLLVSTERIRHDLRANFERAATGADLLVGARGGALPLLLHAVFRLGQPTPAIRIASLEAIQAMPAVDWVVPLSLGDSHRGFPVVATNTDYFVRLRVDEQPGLKLISGRVFEGVFETVLGAEVADRLGYTLDHRIVLAHGDGRIAGADHADTPFTVVGILARTGTPVDQAVHISLAAMQAIHSDWTAGVRLPSTRQRQAQSDQAQTSPPLPQTVTAALVGLKQRTAVFSVQRRIQEGHGEPLSAVLPGVALSELWQLVSTAERALRALSILMGIVSLSALVAVVLTGLDARRRELAILRSVGARPRAIMGLLLLEGSLVTAVGIALGLIASAAVIGLTGTWLQSNYGLYLQAWWPNAQGWIMAGGVLLAGVLASLLPAWRAYRMSLMDGLAPR
jgi:putative ABC transport system permease protein